MSKYFIGNHVYYNNKKDPLHGERFIIAKIEDIWDPSINKEIKLYTLTNVINGIVCVEKYLLDVDPTTFSNNCSIAGNNSFVPVQLPKFNYLPTPVELKEIFGVNPADFGAKNTPIIPISDQHYGHEVIENYAGGKPFKYCRQCRVEV